MAKRLVVTLLLFIFVFCAFSQEEDFRTWWAAELRGEILNAVDFKVTPEIRFIENSTQWSTFLTDFDASYTFLKYFSFGGQYRFEQLQLKNEYLINRFGLYLKAKYKIDRFRFGYRGIYHWEYIGINTREGGEIPDEYHRHKFSVSYYKKKWDLRPEASVEFFSNRKPVETIYEQKLRISLGLEYRFTKKLSLSVNYKYQEEYFVTKPLTAHILATKISYRL